jgi:hypothetical protein
MSNNRVDSQITHHYPGCPPFLFLELKPPLPGFVWILRASQDNDIDTLGMPKITQTGRKGPKSHHVHDVKNEII